MSSDHNRHRKKWQDYGNAAVAEQSFKEVFETFFKGSDYIIRKSPKEFQKIYVNVKLTDSVLSEIYTPNEPITKHGVVPDYAIGNKRTGKTLYVEVKRQDGWVEGGVRSDGRGNAHERSCKYFVPQLLEILRQHSKIKPPALPFWLVFQGNITRDPRRVREITLWYTGYESHLFFWRDAPKPESLLAHFQEKLARLLE